MCAYKDELEDSNERNEEPTEMTAMTGPTHELEPGRVASSTTAYNHNNNNINSYNNNSVGLAPNGHVVRPFRKAWLKNQLRSPAGKCLFLVAVLGLSVLAAYLGSKIVVGGLFMQACPKEPFVPIYLVISSSIFILFIAIICVIFVKCRHRYEEEESISPIYLLSLVYAFIHLVLQLAGSVCVIRTSNRFSSVDKENNKLCNDTLLTYAFGVVIFELILSSIFLILTVFLLCQVIYEECCKKSKAQVNVHQHA